MVSRRGNSAVKKLYHCFVSIMLLWNDLKLTDLIYFQNSAELFVFDEDFAFSK